MGFSITWFILSLVAIPIMLKFGLMCMTNLNRASKSAARSQGALSSAANVLDAVFG